MCVTCLTLCAIVWQSPSFEMMIYEKYLALYLGKYGIYTCAHTVVTLFHQHAESTKFFITVETVTGRYLLQLG